MSDEEVDMRVIVDRDLCEANGVCERLAPEVFRIDDDEELELLTAEPSEAQLPAVREAVAGCPRAALALG